MINLKRKQAIAPLFIILIIALVLLAVYVFMFLPVISNIPVIAELRTKITFFIFLAFFVLVQIALIYGYYELGKAVHKVYRIIRTQFSSTSIKLERFIITHS